MERVILHVDANCFFASVEMAYNPSLADKKVAVVGDSENRHGIILTANYNAKAFGVKTGEPIFKAREKCPDLVTVKSNPERYLYHSYLMKNILMKYSDYVESFGCDEAWVDVTGIANDLEKGEEVAREISERIKKELHITVSIGVSFCKVFAKFASDYKKPDAITVISKENYKDIVWKSPCESLFYVGKKTKQKLAKRGIYTIGDIANTPKELLCSWLGKNGLLIKNLALGIENTPVDRKDFTKDVKSVSNSVTTHRDIMSIEDVKRIVYVLCDSIARRLREKDMAGKVVCIQLRRKDLTGMTHQKKLSSVVDTAFQISKVAVGLFDEIYDFSRDIPLRSIGVSVSSVERRIKSAQISFLREENINSRRKVLELAMDKVRDRYGYYSITRATLLCDKKLTHFNPKDDHRLYPANKSNAVGY